MFREFAIGRQTLLDRMHRDITQAWYVAALSRQKKLPSLQTLLQRQAEQQTKGEMLAAMETLSRQYGSRVRRVPRKVPSGQ